MSTLETRIRQSALAFPGLTNLLGGTDPQHFRWWDTQLLEGTGFPAVVLTIISNPTQYVMNARLATSFARVQFDLWGTDPNALGALEDQLSLFLDALNLYLPASVSLSRFANFIVSSKKVDYPRTQPIRYRRIIDAQVYSNSTLST